METKSVLQSKRSWFNYGSILALGATALLADAQFVAEIKETLGIKGTIGLMIIGALVNQYLAQTSTERPTFELPKTPHQKNLEKLEVDENQSDDTYGINATKP